MLITLIYFFLLNICAYMRCLGVFPLGMRAFSFFSWSLQAPTMAQESVISKEKFNILLENFKTNRHLLSFHLRG